LSPGEVSIRDDVAGRLEQGDWLEHDKTLVRLYVSSDWALLEICASAHPSSVKYHNSTKLKDFSFPMVNWEGWGMMWSATILS